jgi:hypothetical protein
MYAAGKRTLGQMEERVPRTLGQYGDDWGLDLTLEFPDDLDYDEFSEEDFEPIDLSVDDVDTTIPEDMSAAAAEEGVVTGEEPAPAIPPPAPKKAGIPFGMIALGALALYLITQKK